MSTYRDESWPDDIPRLWQSPAVDPRPKFERRLEWFEDIAPVTTSPYVVKGLLDRGAMAVLYGDSNSGKTFLALDLAFHVACRSEWRGRRVNGGAVLYLAAEGGNGIANRLVALKKETGVQNAPIALRRAGIDLLDASADTRPIIDMVADIREEREAVALIVIDTLSRALAGGDENASTDMTAFVRNVDRIREETGATVLVVHHSGKDAAKGARGHSSLRAATDTEIEVAVDEEGNRRATAKKQRDHEGGAVFPFTLKPVTIGTDQDGDPVTTCVVEHEPVSEAKSSLPPRDICRAILADIRSAWDVGNPMSNAPQTKKTERYAPRAIARGYNINADTAEKLVLSWIDEGIIKMDIVDQHTKVKGLRVIGSLG